MTTDLLLPWDYFVPSEAKNSPHLDVFRRTIWPQIRRQLREDHNWEVPEGLEPHWVAPHKAVLWQHNEHSTITAERGEERRWEEEDKGWAPMAPQPVGNASQLAQHFKKGLRMRPPSNGVDARYVEAAVLSEAPAGPEEENIFFCDRHPDKRGKMGFKNWKAYIQHCHRYNEVPENMPKEEAEHLSRHKYVCAAHRFATDNRRLAIRHVRTERRRSMSRPHITVEQMQVRREKDRE